MKSLSIKTTKTNKAMTTNLTAAALLCLTTLNAQASEKLTFQLNWKAGGDHAPIYYALKQGWYKDAGVDLEVLQGTGSGSTAQALSVGQVDLGIVSVPVAFQYIGQGSPIKGVFVAYNDAAYGFYWKKSSGISNIKDLAGKKLGAPPGDSARQLWRPIAAAIGIDADSVEWVNIQPTAKVAALSSGAIHVAPHYYTVHFIYEDVFGDDLGYALLRDEGFNPYDLAYFANETSIATKSDAIQAMIHVTQRAFAACLAEPKPCSDALSQAVSMKAEDAARELKYAAAVIPGKGNTLAVGEFSGERVAKDYEMVLQSFDMKPFDPATAFTNQFIDTSIQYPNERS